MNNESITVLLVDDDDVDAETVTRSFKRLKIANTFVRVRDGEEALHVLRGTGGRDKISKPYIVLLDLNMPRLDGHEFLQEIRSDIDLDDTIVFVLTTSDAEVDRLRAYKRHVAGYILKKQAGDDFVEALELIDHYWRIVSLPT